MSMDDIKTSIQTLVNLQIQHEERLLRRENEKDRRERERDRREKERNDERDRRERERDRREKERNDERDRREREKDKRERERNDEREERNKKIHAEMEIWRKKVIGFTQKDAKAIEREVTVALEPYLKKIVPLCVFHPKSTFPKTLYDPFSGKEITEFDGVYILTNNPEIIRKCTTDTSTDYTKKYRTELVIVEAKHYVEIKHVVKKIKQMNAIRDYIKNAKIYMKWKSSPRFDRPELSQKYTERFKDQVSKNRWDLFDDVHLFMGAPGWSEEAEKEFWKSMRSNNRDSGLSGMLETGGARYRVSTYHNRYITL